MTKEPTLWRYDRIDPPPHSSYDVLRFEKTRWSEKGKQGWTETPLFNSDMTAIMELTAAMARTNTNDNFISGPTVVEAYKNGILNPLEADEMLFLIAALLDRIGELQA